MLKSLFSIAVALTTLSVFADQTRIPDYRTARDVYIYDQFYPNGGKTFYCRVDFTGRSGLQVEHIFPASWMKEAAGCAGFSRRVYRERSDRFNIMEAGLHNLHPAIGKVNQDRSNFKFAIIGGDDGDKVYQHNRIPGGCDFEYNEDSDSVEPPKNVRGDAARAVFYIMYEYGARIDNEMAELLVKWHTDDPVSAHERFRNDKIEELQGNRNIFIDGTAEATTFVGGLGGVGGDHASYVVDSQRPTCNIKGNISRSGRIYHLPSSSSYNRVKIDASKRERWFCSDSMLLRLGGERLGTNWLV